MTWTEIHPALNACLNFSSLVCLILGWRAIRRGDREVHRQFMSAAFTISAVFLVSYVIRFLTSGAHRYPGDGWDRTLYLVILGTHSLLAAIVLPLVLRSIFLARRARFAEHKRIARWTWPIWMYVSSTGVMVYVMLYHLAERL